MIYKELSLSTGGGIIDKNRLAEYSGEPTLFIGLGGTGIDCLKEVKKAIFNRIKPDDLYSHVQEYRNIHFLGVDTDQIAVSGSGMPFDLNEHTEFIDLSYSNLKALVDAPFIKSKASLQWLSEDLNVIDVACNSGGIRQIGRLLLFHQIEQFIEVLRQKVSMAYRNNINSDINVHIFTGISGGTGSGIFLDVCYILQRVLNDLGILHKTNILGYCFLPEINFNNCNILSEKKNYLMVNAYAFLKELDYCMDFQENGSEWDQLYTDGMKIISNKSPVHCAFIIDAKNERGEIHANSYNYAMNVVADFIIRQMTTQGEMKVKDLVLPHNGNLKYLTLGAASVHIPIQEMFTYCASKIMLEFEDNTVITKEILDGFINSSRLRYNDLLSVLENCMLLDEYMNGQFEEKVKMNSRAGFERISNLLEKRLKDIALSSVQGIFCANKILRNNSKISYDLIRVFEGYLIENEERIKLNKFEFERVDNQIAKLLHELQNSRGRIVRHRKEQEFKSFVRKRFYIHAQIILCTEMDEFIRELITSIYKLYEEKFAPICKVLSNLKETAHINLCQLSTGFRNNDYRDNIVNDSIARDICDGYLEQLDIEKVFLRLVAQIIQNIENYENGTDITRIVSEYFSQVFVDLGNRSIEDYLRMKYNTDSENLLTRNICDDTLTTLEWKSTPLLCTEMPLNPCVSIEMCYVPSSSVLLLNALSDFCQMHNNTLISKSHEIDSLTYIQIKPCESILANHNSREQYKTAYDSQTWKGIHLYEDGAYGMNFNT